MVVEMGEEEEVQRMGGNFYCRFLKREGGMKMMEYLENYID